MNLKCPQCQVSIPINDINVATDIALCRSCGTNLSYSELLKSESDLPVDLNRPPKGTWFKRDVRGFEVGASTRSPFALFLVPFMCLWSGGSLGGIYGTQIVKGEFNLIMSLFGIPFLLGTLLFGGITLMTVFGKTVVRVENEQGTLFSGVGPIGFKKRFSWNDIVRVSRTEHFSRKGNRSNRITLEGPKPLHVSGVNEARLNFMLGALKQMHREFRR